MTHLLGKELLRVHPNYQPLMASLPAGMLHGAAHITGGGRLCNLPRILPEGCRASIHTSTWKLPQIFNLIQTLGHVPVDEMYQVFNMGERANSSEEKITLNSLARWQFDLFARIMDLKMIEIR